MQAIQQVLEQDDGAVGMVVENQAVAVADLLFGEIALSEGGQVAGRDAELVVQERLHVTVDPQAGSGQQADCRIGLVRRDETDRPVHANTGGDELVMHASITCRLALKAIVAH